MNMNEQHVNDFSEQQCWDSTMECSEHLRQRNPLWARRTWPWRRRAPTPAQDPSPAPLSRPAPRRARSRCPRARAAHSARIPRVGLAARAARVRACVWPQRRRTRTMRTSTRRARGPRGSARGELLLHLSLHHCCWFRFRLLRGGAVRDTRQARPSRTRAAGRDTRGPRRPPGIARGSCGSRNCNENKLYIVKHI